MEINENATIRNEIPNNAHFVSDKKTPHIKEYQGDDGLLYVDDRNLFNDSVPGSSAGMTQNTNKNLGNIFNKNYSENLYSKKKLSA